MPKEALVVKREILFKEKYFKGFLDAREFDYTPIIITNHDYLERTQEMENNPSIKQIIFSLFVSVLT